MHIRTLYAHLLWWTARTTTRLGDATWIYEWRRAPGAGLRARDHVGFAILDAATWVQDRLHASHDLSKRVGQICSDCAELAPGWWEFDLDCADHNCGVCDVCTDPEPAPGSPEFARGYVPWLFRNKRVIRMRALAEIERDLD